MLIYMVLPRIERILGSLGSWHLHLAEGNIATCRTFEQRGQSQGRSSLYTLTLRHNEIFPVRPRDLGMSSSVALFRMTALELTVNSSS